MSRNGKTAPAGVCYEIAMLPKHAKLLLAAGLAFASLLPEASADPGLMRKIQRVTTRLMAEPDNPELLLRRAELCLEAGLWEEALLDVDQVAASGANVPSVHLLRAQVAWHRGQADLARADLTLFLQEQPDNFTGWWLMARVARQQGDGEAALTAYAQTTALHPNVDVTLEHGRLAAGLGQWTQAEAIYRQGLADLGNAVVVRRALIELLLERQRFAAAVAEIDRVMPLAQVKTEWLLLRAEAKAAAGDEAGAAADRRQALREADAQVARRPSALALLQRARANLALTQLGAARRDAEHVQARAPALPGLDALFDALRRAQRDMEASP